MSLRLACHLYRVTLKLNYFQVLAIVLFGVATWGQTSAYVDSLPIIAGIGASGVFLLGIAGLGLYGTVKHHQVRISEDETQLIVGQEGLIHSVV